MYERRILPFCRAVFLRVALDGDRIAICRAGTICKSLLARRSTVSGCHWYWFRQERDGGDRGTWQLTSQKASKGVEQCD